MAVAVMASTSVSVSLFLCAEGLARGLEPLPLRLVRGELWGLGVTEKRKVGDGGGRVGAGDLKVLI